jgi:hypothetical protein
MGGKACIRGLRVTAAMIVNQIAAGRSVHGVPGDFPYLERPASRHCCATQASMPFIGAMSERRMRQTAQSWTMPWLTTSSS